MQSIADTTGPPYSQAENADELTDALDDLRQHISTAHKELDRPHAAPVLAAL